MSKPWETMNDHSMNLIIKELIKEHSKYTKAKSQAGWMLFSSFIPLLALLIIIYTMYASSINLSNAFKIIMGNNTLLFLLFVYLALAAGFKVCKDKEKEAKKDYKDIRAQVTDNFNNIWRFQYEMAECNKIVEELNKEHKINISYKS